MLSITALLKASAHAPSLNTWLPQTHEAAEVLSGKTVLKHRYPPPDYCPSLQLPSIPTVYQQFYPTHVSCDSLCSPLGLSSFLDCWPSTLPIPKESPPMVLVE